MAKKAKIKKIYFPYIFKNIDKQALQLYLYYDIFIRSLHNRSKIEKESDFQLYYFISKLLGLDVSSGENYELPEVRYSTDELPNNSLWKFYFINSEIPSGIVDEINKSCQSLLDKNKCSMTKFIERNKGNIKLITSEYKRIFGNKINDTSTILFHGPQSGWYSLRCSTFKFDRHSMLSRYFCCYANCLAWYRCVRGTSLLTGDINLCDPKIKGSIPTDITVMQVPHHGSKKNGQYNPRQSSAELFVIPFGYGNKYGHPSTRTISDLISDRQQFSCVTQELGLHYQIN